MGKAVRGCNTHSEPRDVLDFALDFVLEGDGFVPGTPQETLVPWCVADVAEPSSAMCGNCELRSASKQLLLRRHPNISGYNIIIYIYIYMQYVLRA